MSERLWKVLNTDRTNTVADTKFVYPADGEWTEHLAPSSLRLCAQGYHYAEGKDVLDWLPDADTALLCEVEPCPKHKPKRGDNKSVTCSLRIVGTHRLTARMLRLFACDCAQRALVRERAAGREPDARSWGAVRVARRFAFGKASRAELDAAWSAADAARSAACSAAWAAARSAAWAAARSAAWAAAGAAAWSAADAARSAAWSAADAARSAAWSAAGSAEREWQYHRLLQLAGAE